MIVVADAGPLIALARIGRLDFLPELVGEVCIPLAVAAEVTGRGPDRPAAVEVAGRRGFG